MKILHTVESYWPALGGMPEVVAQLSERLAERGHNVTVATSLSAGRHTDTHNGVKIVPFDIRGNQVKGYAGSEKEIKRYEDFLVNGGFDIVTTFAAQQWSVDLVLPILEKIKAKKVFVPTGFSRLVDPLYADYFSSLPERMNQYDMNVFLSDTYQDIVFARKNGVRNIIIIPNGADEREFSNDDQKNDIRNRLGIPQDHFLILHVGSHTGKKGHREAVEIFSRANIRNATLLIIGNSFGRGCTYSCMWRNIIHKFNFGSNKKLIMTSLSRPDTVLAYKTADLFLFPSNIECSPIVLFEAAAAGVPFLASDAGNSAEIVQWTGGGVILPTAQKKSGYITVDIPTSVKLLEKMYEDETLRQQLGHSGYRVWKERFTWDKISHAYEDLYKKLSS